MSDSDGEKKRFGAGTIIFWLAVAGVIAYFVVPGIINPPKDPLIDGLKDPESALRTYQRTAYGFTKMTPGMGFMEMEKIVPLSDWAWYEANYQTVKKLDTLGAARDGIIDAIDPTQGAAIDKRVGLNVIIESGCANASSEILSREIGATEAFFVCRTKDLETKSVIDWKVRVIKDGDLWKVSGFALGIPALTNNLQKGDIVVSEWDLAAEKAKKVAEDLGGAAPAAAAPAAAKGAPAATESAEKDSSDNPLDLLGSADGESDEASNKKPTEVADAGETDPFGLESSSTKAAPKKAAETSDTSADLKSSKSAPATKSASKAEAEDANADPFGDSSSTDESGDAAAAGDEADSGAADGGADPLASLGGGDAKPERFRTEDGEFDRDAAREMFTNFAKKKNGAPGSPAADAGAEKPAGAAGAKQTPAKPGAAPAAAGKPTPKPAPGKPAANSGARPDPGSLVGGTTARVDPALLAPADALINQAAKDWNAQKYKQAVANAEKALKIYRMHLGEGHPKIVRVKKMIEDAKVKADGT